MRKMKLRKNQIKLYQQLNSILLKNSLSWINLNKILRLQLYKTDVDGYGCCALDFIFEQNVYFKIYLNWKIAIYFIRI